METYTFEAEIALDEKPRKYRVTVQSETHIYAAYAEHKDMDGRTYWGPVKRDGDDVLAAMIVALHEGKAAIIERNAP